MSPSLTPAVARIASLLLALLFPLLSSTVLAADDCSGRQAAGYRVLAMDNGRKVAVWYPAAAREQPTAYSRSNNGFMGSVAKDAPPATCPPVPLVLYSHGLGGCALQTLFFTEELARHGYVVAAPDHQDAVCAIGSDELRFGNMRTDQSFLEPKRWNDRSEIDRLRDLRAVIRLIADDPQLGRAADVQRIGAVGHSLGGYTALAMAGGWPSWKHEDVKAVLAFSPYVMPFVAHGTLARLNVPVMYQGAQFDLGHHAQHRRSAGRLCSDRAAEVLRQTQRRHPLRMDQPCVHRPTERGFVSEGKTQRVPDRSLRNRVPRSPSEEQACAHLDHPGSQPAGVSFPAGIGGKR